MGLFLTDPKCIKQREIVNIPIWHEHGYKGKGLVIFHDDLGNTSHNECCVDIMRTILPEAIFYSGMINFNTSLSLVTKSVVHCNETGDVLSLEEFITKYKVNQINNSTTGGNNDSNSPIAIYMQDIIKKYNIIGTGSFGNYSDEPTNRYQGAFIMVSGISYMYDGSFSDYGVSGDACDFSMFMGFQSGTSFSSPFLAGMIGLIRSKYGMLTQQEVYDYLKVRCIDMGAIGKDEKFGYGIPVLGDADMVVKMTIGSKTMLVDGKPVEIDQSPFIVRETGRTVAPVRYVAEPFGISVEWNPITKEITFRK